MQYTIEELHEVNSVGGITHGDGYAGLRDDCRKCFPKKSFQQNSLWEWSPFPLRLETFNRIMQSDFNDDKIEILPEAIQSLRKNRLNAEAALRFLDETFPRGWWKSK